VVARNRDDGGVDAPEEIGRLLMLYATPAVGQIPGRDNQIRSQTVDKSGKCVLDIRAPARSDMEIGDVENRCWHGRPSL